MGEVLRNYGPWLLFGVLMFFMMRRGGGCCGGSHGGHGKPDEHDRADNRK